MNISFIPSHSAPQTKMLILSWGLSPFGTKVTPCWAFQPGLSPYAPIVCGRGGRCPDTLGSLETMQNYLMLYSPPS